MFASGVSHLYNLGGVDEIIESVADMRPRVKAQIDEIRRLKEAGEYDKVGPGSRLMSGIKRGGRKTSEKVFELMEEEFNLALSSWLGGEDDGFTP